MSAATENEKQSVHLNEIGQIALTVQDLQRAKDFYQNTLGMQLLFEAGAMAFFQCGAIRLMLGTSEKAVSNEGTILYFRVEDIHGVHSALKNRGVPIAQEPHLVARMKSHDLWLSFFKDPDGNALALMSEIGRTQPAEKGQ
ncbi:MAG: VOC family protein [Terracidiphilus sp.]|jgi:methylmalonyl-CoA/ethylmalonyl-CoA epimerase